MSAVLQALLPIAVAIFNAVGPQIVAFVQSIAAHPNLDDNGKAAVEALRLELKQDRADLEALKPLPDPKPTAPG